MKKVLAVLFLSSFLLLNISCSKEGFGGKHKVNVFPEHNGVAVFGATLFIKFNSKELPGTSPSDFDANLSAAPSENFIHVEELKRGDYYFFVVGFDSLSSEPVAGGIHVNIKNTDDSKDVKVTVKE